MIVQKKKLWSGLLAVIMILATNFAVYAAPANMSVPTLPQLRWDYTSLVGVSLSIRNGKATLSANVDGYDGVTKITADAILERKNSDGTYTELASWDDISTDGKHLGWSAVRYVSSGYTYRFTLNATVYKDGVGEDVSGTKSMYY